MALFSLGAEIEYGGMMAALSVRNQRVFKKAIRAVYKLAGIMFHRRFVGTHFDTGAHQRYGYKARNPGYKQRKVKQGAPASRDLYFSGTSRAMATSRGRTVVRATSTRGATVKVKLPRWWAPGKQSAKGRKITAAQMRKELRTATQHETGQVAAFVAKMVAAKFRAIPGRVRKRLSR